MADFAHCVSATRFQMKLLRLQRFLRSVLRGIVLVLSLLEVLLRFAALRMKHGKDLSLRERAEWLHSACRIIAGRLSMSISASGILPSQGLVVSNHLSHLDILHYAALMPCVFVSKSEVLGWPLFGILARCGGTIFVERRRVHSVDGPARKIADALRLDVPVVLFPEGTSTDGSTVLPFHKAFFEPAIATGVPIHPAAIGYSPSDGVEADVCYYGEITFFPHLLGVLGRRSVKANVAFGDGIRGGDNRRIAALAAWRAVVSLREEMTASTTPKVGSPA